MTLYFFCELVGGLRISSDFSGSILLGSQFQRFMLRQNSAGKVRLKSGGGSNMRRRFRTVARANGVPRRFLELIVHAPLGKHETRHSNTIRSHSRRGGCGYSSRCLNQGRRANGGYILSSAHKARREKRMRYKHNSGRGRPPKSVASARPYRKRKSRKWQEIAIAAGITCSICFDFSSLEGERQIGFRIG